MALENQTPRRRGLEGFDLIKSMQTVRKQKLNQTSLDLLPKIAFYILELQNQENFGQKSIWQLLGTCFWEKKFLLNWNHP